jgi:hypothetical protein
MNEFQLRSNLIAQVRFPQHRKRWAKPVQRLQNKKEHQFSPTNAVLSILKLGLGHVKPSAISPLPENPGAISMLLALSQR